MNGIVHACCMDSDNVRSPDADTKTGLTQQEMFGRVHTMIETLYRLVQPQERLYLAFDGVAPHAKWNKQRQRR